MFLKLFGHRSGNVRTLDSLPAPVVWSKAALRASNRPTRMIKLEVFAWIAAYATTLVLAVAVICASTGVGPDIAQDAGQIILLLVRFVGYALLAMLPILILASLVARR